MNHIKQIPLTLGGSAQGWGMPGCDDSKPDLAFRKPACLLSLDGPHQPGAQRAVAELEAYE